MRNRFRIIILLCFTISSSMHSQNQKKIDSLERLLNQSDEIHKLYIYKSLSSLWIDKSIDKSLSYANIELELSMKINNQEAEAWSYNSLGNIYLRKNDVVKAIDFYNKSLFVSKKINLEGCIEKSLLGVANSYEIIGKYDKSLKAYKDLLDFYIIKNDKRNESKIYRKIGNQHYYLYNFNFALENYHKSLKLCEELKDNEGITRNLNNIGGVYLELTNSKEALSYYEKAISISKAIKNDEFLAMELNNMGELYYLLKDNIKSLQYCEEALKISQRSNVTLQKSESYYKIGRIYNVWKNYNEAINFYNKGLQIYSELNNLEREARILLDIAKAYKSENNLDKAKEYIDKSINLSKILNSKPMISENYKLLYKLYDSIKDYNKAYEYLKLYSVLSDSISNQEKQKHISLNESNFETYKQLEKISDEKIKAELKLAKQKVLIYISITAVLVLMYILILLNRQLKLRKKLSIENTNKLNLENELNKIRQEKLQSALSLKQRELTTSTLNLSQKNDVLQNVKNKIHKFKSGLQEMEFQSIANEIENTIDENIKLNDDWNNFKLHFEQIHPQFFKKLKETNPLLTNNDLKHCAYIKINLTNKQIAQLLNISLNGVNIARKRLKKKLNLTAENNLSNYLQNY